MRLLSDEQVVHLFGDPEPYLNPDGTIAPAWEASILDVARLPKPLPLSWNANIQVSHIRCHKRIVPLVEAALEEVASNDEAWADLDDFGGCYMWRMRRRNHRELSRHCWAVAFDFDVKDNPQGSPPHMHPATVAAFGRQGFAWGGDFTEESVDGMHFEFADAARMLAGPA